jgi:quercetin dioxygenase-like cupin family protein
METQFEIVRLGEPDEVREFTLGCFELYRIGGREIGRAVYEPGWRWTEHVRPIAGTELCQVGHLGLVLSGTAGVKMADASERVLRAGDFFAIPPGHDRWVIGDEQYVSLHLLGAESYARA